MIEMVYGGSGSGKSEYAEKRLCSLAEKSGCGKKYYLATMIPYGEEGKARVRRHLSLREGKGFDTIEKQTGIGEVILPEKGSLLVECVGNLTANEMFCGENRKDENSVCESVILGMKKLVSLPEAVNVVIVTNNVFEDGIEYDRDTRAYMKALGNINLKLAEMSDRVTEVVCGIPLVIKGVEEK